MSVEVTEYPSVPVTVEVTNFAVAPAPEGGIAVAITEDPATVEVTTDPSVVVAVEQDQPITVVPVEDPPLTIELVAEQGPPGPQNLFIGTEQPLGAPPWLWIETNPDGTPRTFWTMT